MPFVKGQIGNPKGRPVGAKSKTTLLREERRAIFDEEVSQYWKETIKKMRPEYVGDQFMGKAEDRLDITTKGEKVGSLPAEAIAIIEEDLKKKKVDD